ncbi:DNA mismatch repair protein MutT, partial [Vibrio cholerae]|nr:DNA mismatch repair protein MutT [Vibrio cholerae]MCD1189625.1 DNA mismatch repair protein MutT [Vibrio cholerae]
LNDFYSADVNFIMEHLGSYT